MVDGLALFEAREQGAHHGAGQADPLDLVDGGADVGVVVGDGEDLEAAVGEVHEWGRGVVVLLSSLWLSLTL